MEFIVVLENLSCWRDPERQSTKGVAAKWGTAGNSPRS